MTDETGFAVTVHLSEAAGERLKKLAATAGSSLPDFAAWLMLNAIELQEQIDAHDAGEPGTRRGGMDDDIPF